MALGHRTEGAVTKCAILREARGPLQCAYAEAVEPTMAPTADLLLDLGCGCAVSHVLLCRS